MSRAATTKEKRTRRDKVVPPTEPKAPALVQAAPNRWVQLDLRMEVPEVVFCDVIPIDGVPGHFKLVPRSMEKLVRLTPELIEKLGLGRDTTTLKRLIRSHFVDGARTSPQVYTVNLASYFQHLKRCAENPEFWDDPKVRAEYATAYF